jgi:hypothetical protein
MAALVGYVKQKKTIKIVIIFKSFGLRKTNELVVSSNKLTHNFAGLVTSGILVYADPYCHQCLFGRSLWVMRLVM